MSLSEVCIWQERHVSYLCYTNVMKFLCVITYKRDSERITTLKYVNSCAKSQMPRGRISPGQISVEIVIVLSILAAVFGYHSVRISQFYTGVLHLTIVQTTFSPNTDGTCWTADYMPMYQLCNTLSLKSNGRFATNKNDTRYSHVITMVICECQQDMFVVILCEICFNGINRNHTRST